MGRIARDDNGQAIQVFTPRPELSDTLTIADGVATWTIPAGTEAYTFQPSATVTRKLGTNDSGPSFAGSPDSPYGPYGVAEGMTQIVFTGANGVTIVIEAM
jgi:hypothetical protein